MMRQQQAMREKMMKMRKPYGREGMNEWANMSAAPHQVPVCSAPIVGKNAIIYKYFLCLLITNEHLYFS